MRDHNSEKDFQACFLNNRHYTKKDTFNAVYQVRLRNPTLAYLNQPMTCGNDLFLTNVACLHNYVSFPKKVG